jgi:hypothetical protein
MSNYLGNLLIAKSKFLEDIKADLDFIEYKKNSEGTYGVVISARNLYKIDEIGGNSSQMIKQFFNENNEKNKSKIQSWQR